MLSCPVKQLRKCQVLMRRVSVKGLKSCSIPTNLVKTEMNQHLAFVPYQSQQYHAILQFEFHSQNRIALKMTFVT